MKNVILTDSDKDEIEDLKEGLEESLNETWEIYSSVSNWGRTNIWLKIKRYLKYFLSSFKIFIHRKKYGKILGWQQFYALIFCFYCRIFNVKKTFEVYVINFTYKEKKGFLGKVYFKFMKYILTSKYIDKLFVLSVDYIDICSKKFNIDSDKIKMIPFGIPDQYDKYKDNYIRENYILSIGRSNRDYDWLIKEWKHIEYPLYIISDTYKPKLEVPINVKIIDNISGNLQFPYIMGCKSLIIPIKDEKVCSGDTVLLKAMSFNKNVMVTENSTLAETYIEDMKNGHIVSKKSGKLKEKIEKIISGEIDTSLTARQCFLEKFSRKTMGKRIGTFIK